MKLRRYNEFITESVNDLVLESILEAKISFTDEAISLIKGIDSPISGKLINLIGKEVDINQNYIDINKKKSDFVFFKPEDKVGRVAKINSTYPNIAWLFEDLSEIPESGIDGSLFSEDKSDYPVTGDTVQIIKEITHEELLSYKDLISKMGDRVIGGYSYDGQRRADALSFYHESFYLIQWFKGGRKFQTLIMKSALDLGPSVVKNSEISVGRFVRALLSKSGETFTDSEIEQFVYKWRSEIEKLNQVLERRFKVVSGEDIRKYYNVSMYEKESGSLGSSCMRHNKCAPYLDIYVKNSQVKLLIMISEEDSEKICGRALLWEIEPYEYSTKVMDRIYTIRTADETLFKEWAIENKYWYKSRQDFSTYTPFNFNKEDGEIEESIEEFSVKLDVGGDYRYYPYMDSFKFYDFGRGTLYNSSDFGYDYELTDTDGGNGRCSECGGSGEVTCSECDGDGEVKCDECNGRGIVNCDDCDGSGMRECPNCDGEGELDCDTCDGSAEIDCEYCDGDGEVDGESCDNCSGTGKQSCPDCEGGKKTCYRCDGDSEIKCRSCGGDGDVECGDCDGSGDVRCSECGGDGTYSCPECG